MEDDASISLLESDNESFLLIQPADSDRRVPSVDKFQLLVDLFTQGHTFPTGLSGLVAKISNCDEDQDLVVVRLALDLPSHVNDLCDLAVHNKWFQ